MSKKILILHDGANAWYFYRTGLAKAFIAAGYSVAMETYDKPIYDIFDELGEVDILIGQTYNLSPALVNCIHELPDLKVVLQASDWSPFADSIKAKYPILTAQPHEIELTREAQPDLLFVHYMEHRLEQTHGNWIKEFDTSGGVISLLNAADVFDYTNGERKPEYASDLCFISGLWPYKNITYQSWLWPLFNPKLNLNCKIFGSGWGIPQHCGQAPQTEVRHILKSSKVCLNLHEPHSQVFGYDINERVFKLLSNKCLVVSDYVEDGEKLIPDGVIWSKTPQEFYNNVLTWKNKEWNDKDVQQVIQKGFDYVINHHTYFNRASHLMNSLGFTDEANDILTKYQYIRTQNAI